eukprot:scaffold239766_cov26-Tisochrysis_lutea.AAC.3
MLPHHPRRRHLFGVTAVGPQPSLAHTRPCCQAPRPSPSTTAHPASIFAVLSTISTRPSMPTTTAASHPPEAAILTSRWRCTGRTSPPEAIVPDESPGSRRGTSHVAHVPHLPCAFVAIQVSNRGTLTCISNTFSTDLSLRRL